jgi:hypothetical protein
VITEAFNAAAQARARTLGLRGHPVIALAHPLATRPLADLVAETQALFDAIVRGLTVDP